MLGIGLDVDASVDAAADGTSRPWTQFAAIVRFRNVGFMDFVTQSASCR